MSGHTPGPWRAEFPYVKTGRASRYVVVDTAEMAYDDEDRANARLISAAPAMFEYILRRASLGDSEAEVLVRNAGGTESVQRMYAELGGAA